MFIIIARYCPAILLELACHCMSKLSHCSRGTTSTTRGTTSTTNLHCCMMLCQCIQVYSLLLQSCVVDKDFGSDSTQILYVFDDSQSLDILNVTATLEQHIADLMDSSSWVPSSSSIQDAITSLLPGAAASSTAAST